MFIRIAAAPAPPHRGLGTGANFGLTRSADDPVVFAGISFRH